MSVAEEALTEVLPQSPESKASLSGKLGVKLLLTALLSVFGIVTWIVMSVPADRNELGITGELEIKAPEDTEIYVGSRSFGKGTVTLSWNDLLGVSGQNAAASPGEEVDKLAGEGAELVWSQQGHRDVHRGTLKVNYHFDELLYRRADGLLDHLLAITCEFPEAEGRWQSLVIPVRARSSDPKANAYFPICENQQAGNFSRGMIPSRHDHAKFNLKTVVRSGTWPTEVEVSEMPLWSPSE